MSVRCVRTLVHVSHQDAEVRRKNFRLEDVAKSRIDKFCSQLRLEQEVASKDDEVILVAERFAQASQIFSAALEAFGDQALSSRGILQLAIGEWRLDPRVASVELFDALTRAEKFFLSATGLHRDDLKHLRLHSKLKWRIEDSVMQLRGRVAAQLALSGEDGLTAPVWVWKIGEWPVSC